MEEMLLQQLPVLPIITPLIAAALILFLAERAHALRVLIASLSMLVQCIAALLLLMLTAGLLPQVWNGDIGVYSIGAWPAPFGIVLVVDRLSALMLSLNAVVGLAAFTNSLAYWDRAGPHFHTLFQLLLMGINGAFLTGDLFNLFVFFEVLLAASYGLLLHGSSIRRVKAGLHYIVVNLAGSLLFLIGVALLYGVCGSLNTADLLTLANTLPGDERALFDAATSILGVAFLIKAGAWPLNFWLVRTYAVASAPVAAAFAIMTKVGVYVLIRLDSLIHGDAVSAASNTGPVLSHGLFGDGIFYLGVATMCFGIFGMLSVRRLTRLVGHSVIVSTGLLLTVLGLDNPALMAPALFYLIGSVLASAAFFMLAGMTERVRHTQPAIVVDEPLILPYYVPFGVRHTPILPGQDDEIGIAIPAAMAFLGVMFSFCVLLVTGSPPLSGFIAKFALLTVAIQSTQGEPGAFAAWTFVALTLTAGLTSLIALTRIGMRLFWATPGRHTPRLRILEAGPVAVLVFSCIALTVAAGPVMEFLEAAALTLNAPQTYIETVLGGRPAP